MKSPSRRTLTEALYDSFLRFQRRRGIRSRVFAKDGLTLLAARLLGFLEGAPGVTAAELGRVWNAERSVISRTVAKLQRKRLITSQGADDARKRTLQLTAQGADLVKKFDTSLALITNESLSSLPPAQRNELSSYIQCLADSLSKKAALDSSIVQRASEHPVNFGLMRISMCGGMYGGKFFGTALSIHQAQLLDVAAHHEQGIDIASLARETATEQSAVSRSAAQLVRRGLLHKTSASHDRRLSLVFDTAEGAACLRDHCRNVARHFEAALHELSSVELQSFCSLLEQVAAGTPVQPGNVIQERIEVRMLDSAEERFLARGFLVAEAVRRRIHHRLPETLVAQDGISFGLFIDGRLQGICDCGIEGTRWKVKNFLIACEAESEDLRTRFKNICSERFAESYSSKRLQFESL